MNIEKLIALRDNPIKIGISQNFENKPISFNEILVLEQHYNQGHPFPKALRELLFLAGEYCYVMDFGIGGSQQEMQDDARTCLIELNYSINRPFFVVDVYNGGEQFLFVYLDEEVDDPIIYEAYLYPLEVRSLGKKLSDFIEFRINKVKQGYNPF